jgi:hypothetical protein
VDQEIQKLFHELSGPALGFTRISFILILSITIVGVGVMLSAVGKRYIKFTWPDCPKCKIKGKFSHVIRGEGSTYYYECKGCKGIFSIFGFAHHTNKKPVSI